MSTLEKYIPKSSFIKNIVMLVSGTFMAQIITILSSPILTRLYSPAAFGEFGVFSSITSILTVLVCFRYELAIVIPAKKNQAITVLGLSIIVCIITSLLIACFFFMIGGHIEIISQNHNAEMWYVFLPIYVFSSGIFAICNYWYTREEKFKYLARRQILNTSLVVLIEVGLSFLLVEDNGMGLIIGVTLAMFTTSMPLFIKIVKKNWMFLVNLRWRDLKREAFVYREFPLFSSWTAMLNTLSFSLPSLMLSKYFHSEAVGCYNLSYKILDLPISLIGNAVAQAFYPQINSQESLEEKKSLTLKVFQQLLNLGFVPLALISIAAPWIFSLIFGKEWITTGYYTRLLSPWLLVVFVSSPISNLYVVMKKQKEGLIINIFMLIMRFFSLYIGGLSSNSYIAVGLFGFAGTIMWIINNIYILSFVDIRLSEIFFTVVEILKRSIKYLFIPCISLLFNNEITFLISFMCGLWFLYDYFLKLKRNADDNK